jgi:hypothetical protein
VKIISIDPACEKGLAVEFLTARIEITGLRPRLNKISFDQPPFRGNDIVVTIFLCSFTTRYFLISKRRTHHKWQLESRKLCVDQDVFDEFHVT